MKTMTYPEWPDKIGKRGKSTNPDGSVNYFTIVDEIKREASIGPGDKVLYLQKMQHDDGNIELRFGYYIIGKRPRMAGKWTWGQFAPHIPLEDFRAIVEEAKKRGWI